jgi:adenylate cyclase
MTARNYKALATSLTKMAFVTGQPSQAAADGAALEACKKLDAHDCELYASGDIVVARRSPPPMPQPWLVRDPAIERPYVAAQLPLGATNDTALKERIANSYPSAGKSKVFLIAPGGQWYNTSNHPGTEEAMRLGLEHCGHLASSPCMIIAVDDHFVVPIPTLAKVVGFYRPEALVGLTPEQRGEVAHRLAAAPNGWNGIALGSGGAVGVAVGAASEQSALEGALADCAAHGGRDCHIAVLGPFMVEATTRVEAQNQGPAPAPRPGPGHGSGQTEEEKAPAR